MKIFLSKTALYAIVCTTQKISVNQWPSMFKSMAMRTGIDKKDYYLVIEYLQKHTKDIANTAMVNIEKYKAKHLERSAFMPPKGA